jgi:hypothetical protein
MGKTIPFLAHSSALRHHPLRAVLSVWRGGICTHFDDAVAPSDRGAWKETFRLAMLIREYHRSKDRALWCRSSFRTATRAGEKPHPIDELDETLRTRQRARLIERTAFDTLRNTRFEAGS